MSSGKRARSLGIRVLVYFALALMLWLKFKATTSLQTAVFATAFVLLLLTVNYYCVRFIIDYLTSSKAQPVRLVARSTSVFFLVIGVVGLCLSDTEVVVAVLSFSRGVPISEDALGHAWISGFIGMLFAWVGAYELRITDRRIDYFSLFTGERSLERQEIDHARVRVGWFTYSDRFRPMNRLELLPKRSADLHPIIINLRAFKKPDMDVVYEWLGEKLRHE
jgi:hypothetical protein